MESPTARLETCLSSSSVLASIKRRRRFGKFAYMCMSMSFASSCVWQGAHHDCIACAAPPDDHFRLEMTRNRMFEPDTSTEALNSAAGSWAVERSLF